MEPIDSPSAGGGDEMSVFLGEATDDPVSAVAGHPRVVRSAMFRRAVVAAAMHRGVAPADLVPELAGRAIPDEGCWVQVEDTSGINQYAQTVGFCVEPGSVWWVVPCRREVTVVPVEFADHDTVGHDVTVAFPLRLAEAETPGGPVIFYPHEYRRLHTEQQFVEATAGSEFHPYDDALSISSSRREQTFYLRSRGINRETAHRMVLHGWFSPFQPHKSARIPLALEAMSWIPEENQTMADWLADHEDMSA